MDIHTKAASRYTGQGAGDDFTLWLANVDRIFSNQMGLSIFDIEDKEYRDLYNAGTPANEVARQLMAEATSDLGEIEDRWG
jgi:hypothetical protein